MGKKGLTRRQFTGTAAAAAGAVAASSFGAPYVARGAEKVVKMGFLGPLTGEVAGWFLPGLNGAEIWAEHVNAAGGIKIGEDNYMVEIVSYDNEYLTDKSLIGAKKLVLEDEVKMVQMLGGTDAPAAVQFFTKQNMLSTTLLPSDLTPDTLYHLAPAEVHPIYNVTGVEWLAENKPDLKTAAMCAQDDALGKPSVATYLAAFEAAGIEMVDAPLFFDPATTDFAPVMTRLLAANPDILCLDTCYADYVHPLCEQAFQQGYQGQIISCTADFYQNIIEKTSEEFMEGFIFQFPDFDDPALNSEGVNFVNPNEFYAEYAKRYGASAWSAVSWEYASIMDLWADAASSAGSAEPAAVLEAMKADGTGKHAFGTADWWGTELFGIDNALVGNWPVVVIEGGKATIKEFRSIPAWWDQHKDLMIKHMTDLGQMWNQRG
jgi:branched-chain amino acid transport system substrate-binding protein